MTPPARTLKRIGHKGADLIAPGNTIESFDAALAAGVDMVEFDVLPENRDRSGRLVLAHDYDVVERGAAITAMAEAFEAWVRRQEPVGGLISAGGSGGSALVAPAMRALPIGVPKVLISSVASGNVAPYVGPSDIMMLYSVTDVSGLNSVSRQVLANGAAAMVGMVKARAAASTRSRSSASTSDSASMAISSLGA